MSYKGGIYEAIKSLQPFASFGVTNNDYDTLEWFDDPTVISIPTKDEVFAEHARLEADHYKKEYQRQRAAEYPPIGDQLDALFHAGVFPPEMAAQIQAIKDKYPKQGAN